MAPRLNSGDFNFSFNSSFEFRIPRRVPVNSLNITVIVLGFVGFLMNMLLLFVLYKDPLKRFRNPANVFITSLAMADTLSVSFMVLSKLVSVMVSARLVFAQAVFSGIMVVGTQSSFLVVAMLASERFSAIVFPFRYKSVATTRRACYANLASWCVALVVASIFYLSPEHNSTWLVFMYSGEIVFLCLGTLLMYPVMYRKFWLEGKRISALNSGVSGFADRRLQLNKQLTVTVLLITSTVVISNVPYLLSSVFVWFGCTRCLLDPVFLELCVFYPVVYVCYFAMNPLVYAWRLAIYRKSLTIVFCGRQQQPRSSTQATNNEVVRAL